MRPKFKATDMSMTEIRDEVTKRGWKDFRSKVYMENVSDFVARKELYIEKLYWWEVKRLPRLRAVK